VKFLTLFFPSTATIIMVWGEGSQRYRVNHSVGNEFAYLRYSRLLDIPVSEEDLRQGLQSASGLFSWVRLRPIQPVLTGQAPL
jgi:hypothetical protein